MNSAVEKFPMSSLFAARDVLPALVRESDKISWGELHLELFKWNRVLSDFIAHGEKCAILAKPDENYIFLLLGLWMKGIIAVPLNARLPGAAIRKQLDSINCRLLIAGDEFIDNIDESIHILSLSDICSKAQKSNPTASDIDIPLNQPATIIFTSGSSGQGKACLHTFGNHYFNALGSNENILLEENDSWLLSLPLFHVAGIGILFRCLLSGAAIALPSDTHSLAGTIRTLQPTHISLVATQLQQLLDDTSVLKHLRSMKVILLGGSAIPEALIQRAVDLGLPFYTSYGSTETASQITTSAPQATLEHLAKSGRVLPYRKLKIGAGGEILVSGACLGAGYVFGDRIESFIDSDGWFHSGDSGFCDDEGYLQVNGRLDAMFISGGENIHPENIEKEMLKIKGVQHVIVVPISDVDYGQRPTAFVKMERGYALKEIKLAQLANILPKYKIPVHLFPWPKDYASTGIKIERKAFQKLAEQTLSSD